MIQRPGMYNGEVKRDEAGDMQFYIWRGSSWELYYGYGSYGGAASAASSTGLGLFEGFPAPYTNAQRMLFVTIDTRIGQNNEPVLAKAYLNGNEIADQSNALGRTTFNLSEESILNESLLTFVSGDLRPIKRFRIQSRKTSLNDVTIIEIDENGIEPIPVTPPITQPSPPFSGGGGGTGGGGGGGQFDTQSLYGNTNQTDKLLASTDQALALQ